MKNIISIKSIKAKIIFALFFAISFFYAPASLAADPATGTFVSKIQNLSAPMYPDAITWLATVPTDTGIKVKVRSANNSGMTGAPDWTSCTTEYTITASGSSTLAGNNCLTNGHTYLEYQAVLASTNSNNIPTLDSVTFSFTYPTSAQTLTSSVYNTETVGANLSKIQWTENLPSANTDIKFQIRTSPDGTTWTQPWCGPENGTTGTCDSSTYFIDHEGGEIIDDIQKDKSNDQYFQYKAYLSTTDGLNTPTLSDVTVSYSTIASPTVTTGSATNIAIASATLGGTVTDTGGENPTRYIEWGSSQGEPYPNSCDAGIGGVAPYTCNISNLSPGTTYYYRAKAGNTGGINYGSEQSFITLPRINIVSEGQTYLTSVSPTITGSTTSITLDSNSYVSGTPVTSPGSHTLTATNASGSTTINFTLITTPAVTTDNISDITATTAQGHGTITATGGQNPTRFIQWRTTSGSYSDINNFCSSGTGTDSYACNLTNLSPDTTYYYRAKAVNDGGTSYGDENNFQTMEGAVIIYDPDSDKIGQAISSSYFTIEGGNASNTTQAEANTDITLINTDTNSSLTIPEATEITKTGGGSFDFSEFIIEDALNQVKSTVSESWGAIKIGIPTIGITFSQPISVSIYVGAQYNGKEIEVQYQNEGETDWTHETTCTVANGQCTFTTTHATTFTANGDGTFSSADPVDINLAINAGIAINCDPDVTLGPIVQDGKSDLTDNSATCTIRTNNSDGYSLTLKADEPNLTSASDTLNPITASSTPTTWDGTAVPNTASGWGYRLSTLSTIDDAKWGTDDQTGVNYGTNAKWYKATASDYQIVAASSETDNDGDSEILNFGAEIGAGMIQPTGTYTTTVTLTAITL